MSYLELGGSINTLIEGGVITGRGLVEVNDVPDGLEILNERLKGEMSS